MLFLSSYLKEYLFDLKLGLIILLLLNIRCFAQEVTFVSYNFRDNDINKVMHLFFDSSRSLCIYNRFDLVGNQMQHSLSFKNNQQLSYSFSQTDSLGILIYRSIADQLILIRYPKVANLDPFITEDSWTNFNWVVSKRRKKIMGYTCVRATARFRGRNYIVWFAPCLPYSFGPWKFFGLPGLIIHAYDDTKTFEWTMSSIQKGVDMAIKRPYEEQSKTLKEYVFYLDNQLELIYNGVKEKVDRANDTLSGNKRMSISRFDRHTSVSWGRRRSLEVEYEFEKESQLNKQSSSAQKSTDTTFYKIYNFER